MPKNLILALNLPITTFEFGIFTKTASVIYLLKNINMKSLSTLSILIVLSLLVNINNVFSYEEKTLKEITTVSTDSLIAKSLLSAYYGDTLVVKGVVGVSVLVNVSKGDRRPIMLTGEVGQHIFRQKPQYRKAKKLEF